MKRTKIFATIITLCLAISTLAYGVYAATNLSFGITANVAFVVDNVFFELQMNIKGAYDQGGTALGDLNYNYNTTGVANPRETYSDATLVTETMLNTWVNSLTIPALYFNPDAITPIELEVIVRNHTPNKNIVVEICEWDTTGVGSKIEPENSALYQYAEIFEMPGMGYNYIDTTALTGDALTDEIENQTAVATYEYELLSLATPITTPIQRNWKISINGYNVETSTGDNPAFTIVDGTGDNAGQKILTAYSGTSQALFVPREVTQIGDGENQVVESATMEYFTFSNTLSSLKYNSIYGAGCSSLKYINLRGTREMSSCALADESFEVSSINFGKLENIITEDSVNFFNVFKVCNMELFSGNQNYYLINHCLIKNNEVLKSVNIRNVKIPQEILSIKNYAFYNCEKAIAINLPNTLETVGNSAFSGCTSLTSIKFPDTLVSIGDGAFSYCTSLTSIILPDTLETIGIAAFRGCTALETISIGNGVNSLGNFIDDTAYYNDTSNWTDNVLYLTARDGVTKYLIDAKTSIAGSYVIDSNTKVILGYAFSSCSSLTSIYIPSSVIYIGEEIFSSCYSSLNINCQAISKPNGWDTDWDIRVSSIRHTNINWGVQP